MPFHICVSASILPTLHAAHASHLSTELTLSDFVYATGFKHSILYYQVCRQTVYMPREAHISNEVEAVACTPRGTAVYIEHAASLHKRCCRNGDGGIDTHALTKTQNHVYSTPSEINLVGRTKIYFIRAFAISNTLHASHDCCHAVWLLGTCESVRSCFSVRRRRHRSAARGRDVSDAESRSQNVSGPPVSRPLPWTPVHILILRHFAERAECVCG